ncbi:MAG: gamma-glutamylcyclotransferase [Qingshengfaniella sp.]
MTEHAPRPEPALWVFGYGSLLWNPGFPFVSQDLAILDGYRRSFCMWSIHHRGSEGTPGLVLALDRHDSACCQGVAFGVAEAARADTLAGLRERELVSSAYHEIWLPVRLADGRSVEAVTYVVDPDHRQYCGGLALERQAEVIARAHGGRGPNSEYLINTAQHLRELDIADPDLEWLEQRVAALGGGQGTG